MASARDAVPAARPLHACPAVQEITMASTTHVEDTEHNIRAKQLFDIFRNENVSAKERTAAADDFFFMFINLAYTYAARVCPKWGQNAEDIKQTAGLGLCVARDKWEPSRGPFAVILFYCVQNQIRNWLRENETIIRSHKTFQDHHTNKKSNDEYCDTAPIRVMSFEGIMMHSNQEVDRLSLDPGDPNAQFSDRITTQIAVHQILSVLPQNERTIIMHYYALDGGEPKTLRETAEKVGCSHESVRQMRLKAERTMRISLHGCV
jgi:RNA polymerase sigma factor (sigma-70 family)